MVKFKTAPSDVDGITEALGSDLGLLEAVPLFPCSPRYEERHHKAGLDRWYTVRFKEDIPVSKAISSAREWDMVEYAEPVTRSKFCAAPTGLPIFNDPLLSSQWHYINTGSNPKFRAGIDVNLQVGWQIETGSEDVIVAVIDDGVLYTHQDLADAMWVNKAELEGEVGVDDDGNGYNDDIYGYNFTTVNNTSPVGAMIEPGDHGTHIAGTIAAVNNNNIGVCGIAGGNGTKKGVRIMSVQTNHNDSRSAFIAQAFVYAADNGAVLANCSWSIAEDSRSIREAIDYFNEYAGFDENGNQVGPMAGGLAIFAAGNDSREDNAYPASYEGTFSVASVGPTGNIAYYSNYGDWVDITAPGGDYKVANSASEILSTLSTADDAYGTMQGTSMACPHVTGVAALVVSALGGPGFTREKLINRLQETANPVIYEYNPSMVGKMGTGLIDAGAALKRGGTEPPEKVADLRGEAKANIITLKWSVPSDPDDGKAVEFRIFHGKSSSIDSEKDDYVTVSAGSRSAGDGMEYVFDGLEFSTDYYFAVQALDISSLKSELSDIIKVSSLKNNPPVFEMPRGESITLKAHESGILTFSLRDPDGHPVSVEIVEPISGIRLNETGADSYELSVNALTIASNPELGSGTYAVSLVASDTYDEARQTCSVTVLENHAPSFVGNIPSKVFNKRQERHTINLDDCFADEDGETLSYSVSSSNQSIIVKTEIKDGILELESNWYGTTDLTVIAKDALGAEAGFVLSTLVRDGSQPVDVFPNPISDVLNVRTGEIVDCSVSLISQTGAVVLERTGLVGPFDPMTFDVKDIPAGNYVVKTVMAGETNVKNIVKL